MKRILIAILMMMPAGGWAQDGGRAEAEKALKESVEAVLRDEALREAVVSVCARTADGRELVGVGAEKMVMPASNIKLITTGAAMHTLGADYSFETKIGHDGTVEDGVLNGNLYIIGGGDPTMGSKDSLAVNIERTFAQWMSMLNYAGIKEIRGHVIGDGRHFDGMPEHPTWLWNDIGVYYGAGATGLMFYENMQSFNVRAGAEPGDPVNITPSYPSAPWMEFRYDCTTGKAGTGDQLYMYTSDLAPVAEIRGTFGVDRAAKRVDCSNKFPEYTIADYFNRYLGGHGIPCTGGPADFRLCRDIVAVDSITVIGSTFSPSLKRIVFETNFDSNNLYAEALYKTLGRNGTGSACYDSCAVAFGDIFKSLNVSDKGANIVDGSGLSRQNYVSADFFCRFLTAMTASPCFDDYLATIPSPGSNGTMESNMSSYPSSVKSRIKAKSGSMNGVRCYSGYVLPTDGGKDDIIVFSVMVNNCTAPTWKLRQLLDKIMAALAAAN